MKSTTLIVPSFAIVMLVLVATGSGGPVRERTCDDDTKLPINAYKRTVRDAVSPKLDNDMIPKKTKRQKTPLPPSPPENLTDTNVRGLRAAPGGNNAKEGNEEQWVNRIAQNGNHGKIIIKRNDSFNYSEDAIGEGPNFEARRKLESSEIGAIVNN